MPATVMKICRECGAEKLANTRVSMIYSKTGYRVAYCAGCHKATVHDVEERLGDVLHRRERAREARWLRTGVSATTVGWMKRNGML